MDNISLVLEYASMAYCTNKRGSLFYLLKDIFNLVTSFFYLIIRVPFFSKIFM